MLRHPIALGAIVVLSINDHLLKAHCANAVTGKLSDIAGLVFFPLLLAELWRLLTRRTSQWQIVMACIVTGAGFSAVKLLALPGDAYRWGLAYLQWPFRALIQARLVDVIPVQLTQDPTDLLALPALGIALWLAGPHRSKTP